MTHEPPDEQARRRPDFRADVPVVMADGRTWYLPQPRMVGRYHVPDGENEIGLAVTEFGPEYDFRVEEAIINNIHHNMSDGELYWLGRTLLQKNYDLMDRDMYWLLQFRKDDPDNERMWADIFGTAIGMIFAGPTDPKAPTPDDPTS